MLAIATLIGSKVRKLVKKDDSVTELRSLLRTAGYHIYNVHRNKHRHRNNMLIVNPDDMAGAMWIFERDGQFVLRAWHNHSYGLLLTRFKRLHLTPPRFIVGKTLRLQKDDPLSWTEWLSEASKKELQALRYIE